MVVSEDETRLVGSTDVVGAEVGPRGIWLVGKPEAGDEAELS